MLVWPQFSSWTICYQVDSAIKLDRDYASQTFHIFIEKLVSKTSQNLEYEDHNKPNLRYEKKSQADKPHPTSGMKRDHKPTNLGYEEITSL
jgi:hypothetical protein